MSEQTRSSLIRRVGDPRDHESWREFVALYEPLLLSYARRLGLQEQDARDLVQDLFLKLREVLPTFTLDHGRGRFRGWLRTMTRNLAIDWFRREGQRRRLEEKWRAFQAEQGGTAGPGSSWLAAHELPEAEWNDACHRRVLTFVLEQGKAQWQVKTWACFEQWILADPPRAAADIARDLDIQAHAVRVNANRVLAWVRERCAEYLEELGDEQRDLLAR